VPSCPSRRASGSARGTTKEDQLEAIGRIADVELQVRRRDGSILEAVFSGEVIETQGWLYSLTVTVGRASADAAPRRATPR
jgi:hypothetical protein